MYSSTEVGGLVTKRVRFRSRVSKLVAGLEILVGIVFLWAYWNLPSERVLTAVGATAVAGSQTVKDQAGLLIETSQALRNSDLPNHIDRLKSQSENVARILETQTIDFKTIETVRDGLRDSADGLDRLAMTVDPVAVRRVSDGLAEIAAYLDERLVPRSEEAATKIRSATKLASDQGIIVKEFLDKTPLDLAALRRLRDSMRSFSEFAATSEEFLGSVGLSDVARVLNSAVTTIDNTVGAIEYIPQRIRPNIEGLRQSTKVIRAIQNAIETFDKKMVPQLRRSLFNAQQMLDETGKTIDTALSQQVEIESVLKQLPTLIARSYDNIQQIGDTLANILHETGRVSVTADVLRQTHRRLDGIVSDWPQLQASLGRGGVLLRAAQRQLDVTIANRDLIEDTQRRTLELVQAMHTNVLPSFKSDFDQRINDEIRVLENMRNVCTQAQATVPSVVDAATAIVHIAQALFLLGAVLLIFRGGREFLPWPSDQP